jgi:urease gamma subunit
MAFPAKEKTFKLENCRDLYNKLDREIARFDGAANNSLDLADHAFNVVVTAWHMCDWVFADMTPELKSKLQINTLAELQAEARKCRALHLCQQAANASKHWALLEKHRDPGVDVIVGVAPVRRPEEVQEPPKFEAYFKDGSDFIEAGKVFETARDFWTQFIFVQHRIAA